VTSLAFLRHSTNSKCLSAFASLTSYSPLVFLFFHLFLINCIITWSVFFVFGYSLSGFVFFLGWVYSILAVSLVTRPAVAFARTFVLSSLHSHLQAYPNHFLNQFVALVLFYHVSDDPSWCFLMIDELDEAPMDATFYCVIPPFCILPPNPLCFYSCIYIHPYLTSVMYHILWEIWVFWPNTKERARSHSRDSKASYFVPNWHEQASIWLLLLFPFLIFQSWLDNTCVQTDKKLPDFYIDMQNW